MTYLLNFLKKWCLLLLAAAMLISCAAKDDEGLSLKKDSPLKIPVMGGVDKGGIPFEYEINPEDFSLILNVEGENIPAAMSMENRSVTNFKKENGKTSWVYPKEEVSVTVSYEQDFLTVSITADTQKDTLFKWPQIMAEEYYIPLGEGKGIPADDIEWMDYLQGEEFSVLEQLSMPFWALSMGEYGVVYIMEDPYRTQMNFLNGEKLSFNISYEYPEIVKNRTKSFRIYLTENSPAAIARVYKNYLIEKGKLVTLEEKAVDTPEIKKLYGAPFIYLWGDMVLSPEDVKWNAFLKSIDGPMISYFLSFADAVENGAEFKLTLKELKNQDYIALYQKNVICRYISDILIRDDFYNSSIFTKESLITHSLSKEGIENLTVSKKIQLNKDAIAKNMPEIFNSADTWMDKNTIDLIRDIKKSGIDNAWIGLHGYEQAFNKPEIVAAAREQGFLIASYDSYHSIHQPNNEQWETAKFDDTTLYENATVTDKNGKKLAGFQNVGRKLNPVLAFPSVKARMENIVNDNELFFNSWFVDCDATGEIYDDYSPMHITTQEEDLAARMNRMAYINDTYKMVVGSEGGNDFAAKTIAFAHGIEMKSFSWMDEDMKKNKDSEYYMGRYYNASGGVAEHFAKRVPLKEKYYTLFVDASYDLPLFKLVYNDSVITSYHWEWSSFKIKGATQERMLREVLYNVPPLYHLDMQEWEEYKEDITAHLAIWADFSRDVALKEMKDFEYLTADRLVQRGQYGEDIYVVANFTDEKYQYQGQEIPEKSALIYRNGDTTVYTPTVDIEHE